LNLSNICNKSLNDIDINRVKIINNETTNNANLENVIISSNLQYDNYLTFNTISDFSHKIKNNSSDSDISSSKDQNILIYDLTKWAIKRHISHLAVTDLLHILSPLTTLYYL